MPFNLPLLSQSRRRFILSISSEDLALSYDVESEVVSTYGVSTRHSDLIILNIAAVNLVAASTGGYAIDADGLHNEAELHIVFTSGALVSGRGGNGGAGGDGEYDFGTPADVSTAGQSGSSGGDAIRYGCPTTLMGTGTVSKGYGGGGGGGGAGHASASNGGGGGGGGAPLGTAGAGGIAFSTGTNGAAGSAATVPDAGSGGLGGTSGVTPAGDGGDGGDSGAGAGAGAAGTQLGGAAGADGDAIITQGFSHSAEGGITITGTVV